MLTVAAFRLRNTGTFGLHRVLRVGLKLVISYFAAKTCCEVRTEVYLKLCEFKYAETERSQQRYLKIVAAPLSVYCHKVFVIVDKIVEVVAARFGVLKPA